MEISCTSVRACAWRTVIFQPGYKHFLTSNFADCNEHTVHDSYFIETYLVDNSDSDRSEGPEKSTEIETMEVESGSHRGQTILFQHVVLRQSRLLSLLSYLWHYNRYFAFTRDNRTHPTPNRGEDVWRQKLVINYLQCTYLYLGMGGRSKKQSMRCVVNRTRHLKRLRWVPIINMNISERLSKVLSMLSECLDLWVPPVL